MKEIKITKKNPPIPKGFCLNNMSRMNIIVGQNNVGKTKFFEVVEDLYDNSDDVRVDI